MAVYDTWYLEITCLFREISLGLFFVKIVKMGGIEYNLIKIISIKKGKYHAQNLWYYQIHMPIIW